MNALERGEVRGSAEAENAALQLKVELAKPHSLLVRFDRRERLGRGADDATAGRLDRLLSVGLHLRHPRPLQQADGAEVCEVNDEVDPLYTG